MKEEIVCACGAGLYESCCQPFHSGTAFPVTATQLMRSRYCAFALGLTDYLSGTQSKQTTLSDQRAMAVWCRSVQWISLQVLSAKAGGEDDTEGTVEFVARYIEKQQLIELKELSHFEKRNERWVYTDGKPQVKETKLDFKQLCPCGSQKKFGRCHA
jgi:SEC-C motif domain protein